MHHGSVDNRFSKSPTSCLLRKETAASCGERLGFPGLEEVRVLSYHLFSCLEGARCHHAGWGTAEAVTRAPRHGRGRCGRREPHPRHPLAAGKLGGTAVYCSNRCFSFFFFFSPMETLNHVSAFPVIYIGHDSYQGGLPRSAQTHQPTKDAGHLFVTRSCPWDPRIRCFYAIGILSSGTCRGRSPSVRMESD